jgi:hypothetical protein
MAATFDKKSSHLPVKSLRLRFLELLGFPLGEGHWLPPKPWRARLCRKLGIEPADRWVPHK